MGYSGPMGFFFLHENTRLPSWRTGKAMGYRRLWVIKGMVYESAMRVSTADPK